MTHYHLIGIGGTGLSAIASILFEKGNEVSGSDLLLSPLAKNLIDKGIQVSIGHEAKNIIGADIIIRSSAIPDSNPEVIAGNKAGIPIFKRRDFLGQLTNGKQVIAIAGTHGKTTTTAMIAWTLYFLGMDPSYIVGGILKNTEDNAHFGNGEYFVIEADEYDRMFLGLSPDILIITNIEYDHPDCFPTKSEYVSAFHELSANIKSGGILITFSDNPGIKKLLSGIGNKNEIKTYGTSSHCDFYIKNIHPESEHGIRFLLDDNSSYSNNEFQISLAIPGDHNALNATAALMAMQHIGLSMPKVIKALGEFSGTKRRFDILGEANGITFIDDYAHHPTEIRATLNAARKHYPRRNIWVVWQPHTYSRTQELFNDFVESFFNSDHVIVTEIYASREKTRAYSSKEIAKKINHPDVRFISKLEKVAEFLEKHLSPGDVLIVLSAGDANIINQIIMRNIQKREVPDD
ncbi:MAG: UDP-N-acetylmuramate--L-alanine ligase [Anaerolineaceae bacterium]|nr:UDP-N-acetylmuramate--L-alanine ligase [Anaerolineaceae bacterium]